MTAINFKNLRYELVNTLRNGNIFSISVRGVSTATNESFTATGGQTTYVLTNNNPRNIRSLSVNAVAKTYLRDYTVEWSTKTITFLSALSVSDAVLITYDYGTSDKIFPDMPRNDLTLTSFPRIGMEITSMRTEPFQLGGTQWISDAIVTIFCWMPVNKDSAVASGLGGTDDLSTTISSIRQVIQTNTKSLVTVPYITPLNLNPITKGTSDKLFQQSMDFELKFITEGN